MGMHVMVGTPQDVVHSSSALPMRERGCTIACPERWMLGHYVN